ncbi:AlpA family transcriptional regulator [Rheinheimera sp. UJ51]|uniref:helix-turn-helix transcriptional regulator n=1 Tax=Rheinheimera sp. UJ51 TaxID=2892446 RepID=UPI001E3032F7|nr:AlpA family transcriptional regulator [Rheinheimera sp. UJ51]MCC5451689.1 AlpA family transcriptional regulator [Rheinheimera sp. UJ51]
MNSTNDLKCRLLKRSEVSKATTLCKTSIYELMKTGDFPKPINIGGRRVAWLQSDIETWITDRLALAGRAA